MKQNVRYIMVSERLHSRASGTYLSYDIVAWDVSAHAVVVRARYVTTDRELALHITEMLNQYRVPPQHMADAVKNLLK